MGNFFLGKGCLSFSLHLPNPRSFVVFMALNLGPANFDPSARRSSSFALSRMLWIGSLVLLGTSTTTIVFSAFPFQPIRPEWQMKMVATLLGSGVTGLIGALFAQLSFLADRSRNNPRKKGVQLIRKLAGFVAIGYLLLVPIQMVAGFSLLRQTAQQENQPKIQWGKFRSRILATESEAELREFLAQLPNPTSLPENLGSSLQQFKQNLITDIDARFAARATEIQKAQAERFKNFLLETARGIIQSLLFAAGFLAISKQDQRLPVLGDVNQAYP